MSDLEAWLNLISPDAPCFDQTVCPVPGPPTSLCMIDAIAEHYLARRPVQPIRVLEIGSWVGTSAITWGKALERCGIADYLIYCCDLWYHPNIAHFGPSQPQISNGRHGLNHAVFRHNIAKSIGWSHVVEVIGDSAVSLSSLRDNWFDLIYVDGWHGYTRCCGDIEAGLRLCRPDGIICGDDFDCVPADAATLSEDELEWFEQKVDGKVIHGGVVLAVHELLGAPRPFGSFWGFERAGLQPIDCTMLPRRVPSFLPEAWRGQIEEMLR